MVGLKLMMSVAEGTLVASQLTLAAVIMPAEPEQERIDPVEIDRFSQAGLGKPETMRALADAFCALNHNQPTDQFLAAIDIVLADVLGSRLPIPSISIDDLELANGRFSASGWVIALDTQRTVKRSHSKEDLQNFLATLVHELRHAEQFYAAARYEAGGGIHKDPEAGKTNRAILRYSSLPSTVIEQAERDPAISGSEDFEFGRLISDIHVNAEIREKHKYIGDVLDSSDITLEDYEYYLSVINNKIPEERDAVSIEKMIRKATDKCLEKW